MAVPVIEHYVIIVSEHNLAELRACKYFRPGLISLIASESMQPAAQRLVKVLQEQLPDSRIHLLTGQPNLPLDGQRTRQIQQWINHCLKPALQENAHRAPVLNMTGGTKTMATLLLLSYSWQEIHYQPFIADAHEVKLERLQVNAGQLDILESLDLATVDIMPLSVAQLYSDHVRLRHSNVIQQHPDSLRLAQLRLAGQSLSHYTMDNLWPALTPVLEAVWYAADKDPAARCVRQPWSAWPAPRDALIPFLDVLNQLHGGSNPAFSWDEEAVTVPTRKRPDVADWCNWISGGWYEQLVAHWLVGLGHDSTTMQSSVQIAQGESQGRETDILLMQHGRLHVLEIKANVPVNQPLSDLESRLTAMKERLGKIDKVLVVTPATRERIAEQKWREFERQCQASQVKMLIAASQADLAYLSR